MKKVCLFLILAVFALGSSGFKAVNNEDPFQEVDCNQYAADQWQEAVDVGLRGEVLNIIFEEQYWYCETFINPL